MPDSYPYIISNNKIEPILSKIRAAARPDRFTRQLLNKMGFTASNDRAMINVLKELGFINENGAPTEDYDRLRDQADWRYVLGERVKDLYSDLYAINTSIHNATDEEIKGAISRVTGKDDKSVNRYYSTFKTLASLAKFEPSPAQSVSEEVVEKAPPAIAPQPTVSSTPAERKHRETSFHYNIQIHLPATTDISVYNAIFKAMKENLLL